MIFENTTLMPNTKRTLVILEPTTLPSTISEDPSTTAKIDVANSGKDVPKANMVTPIMNDDIPYDLPIISAAPINLSEAKMRTARLRINSKIVTTKGYTFDFEAKIVYFNHSYDFISELGD